MYTVTLHAIGVSSAPHLGGSVQPAAGDLIDGAPFPRPSPLAPHYPGPQVQHTPLTLACRLRSFEVAQTLMKYGAIATQQEVRIAAADRRSKDVFNLFVCGTVLGV